MTDLTMGQRIAECRKKLGISQEALGERMGVSRQAISKWEADGAVPEIDKLIGLSKLFNVSVGWLLGVEEMPGPAEESPQISEELLRKIEEIVLRYRPRKEKLAPWKKWCIGLAAVLVLWGIGTFANHWSILSSTVGALSAQTRTNNEQNASILSQLDALESRMEDMNDAVLNPAPTNFSISDYSFHIEPNLEEASATIVLSAIPGSWNEEYQASLSVRLEGQQVVSQACHWDGTGLTSRLVLPLENGYEYWFTAEYADGTQEQVELTDSIAQNLEHSFTIQCEVTQGDGYFDLKKGTLELLGYEIHLVRPGMTSGYPIDWAGAELVLYHTRGSSRQIADTYTLFDPEDHKDEQSAGTGSQIGEFRSFPNGPLQIPEVEEGDGFELWVKAEMSNGISLMQLVTSWAYNNGEFIGTVPVEE